ncbi:adenylate kinase [Clostridia bacterium]|nr:adenylate kinase [Clostridia bacterium]
MRIVVLGAPGAGKGTQARNLARFYNTPHVSTGDMLRQHMKERSSIGLAIKDLMDKGALVPDEIVTRLIAKQLADGAFVLDGYPRTLQQAGVLSYFTENMGVSLEKVVYINVADDVIMERMTGRVYCSRCGETYHTHYHPPVKAGRCNVCGGDLVQREDDKAYTVANRLKVYHEMTEPIINYYRDKGLLLEVSGVGDIGGITSELINAIGENHGNNC